jgi:hypothetical protein
MRPMNSIRILLVLVVCLLAVSVRPAAAQGVTSFTGFYQVTAASDNGDGTTTVSFSVQVFNYSGTDLSGVTVDLANSVLPNVVYGAFALADLPNGGGAIFTGDIIVPNSEYSLWGQNGNKPNFTVQYQDANSNPVTGTVTVTQAPVGEGQ